MKINQLPQVPTHFIVNHPLLGTNKRYDSWIVLCDEAIDVARDEAQRQLYDTHLALTKVIADEIIETAVDQYGT